MSLTGLMSLLGSLVMIGSWAIVRSRARKSRTGGSAQIHYLMNFFLYMGIFCLIIFLPLIALNLQPGTFPFYMAWAYIIGHCFAYIGMLHMLALTFSMVPRLLEKQRLAVVIGSFAALIITVVTVVTMGFGTQPQYDYDKHVAILNASPIVGAMIGLFALTCVMPAAVLMIVNGVRNPASRLRSYLLGGGLVTIMIAGPLHDIATSWQLYMTADIVSMIGFCIVSGGILYRFEERIAPAMPLRASSSRSL